MRTKKWFFLVSSVAIMGLLWASCAPEAPPAPTPKPTAAPAEVATPAAKPTTAPAAPTPTPKPAAEQPRYGGTLKIGDLLEARDYDIHQAVSVSTHAPLAAIYNSLLQLDPVGDPSHIIGDLAERWEASRDGRAYTFHLRKDVKWHDGKPFTSDDVRFSIDRQANPPKGMISPRAAWFEGIDRIETPDANTVRITLQYPRAAFIPFMACGWSKVLAMHVVQAFGDAKSTKAQVGTGPFKFKDYSSGVVFEAVKNPDYFVKGRPYLDSITRYYIKDDATRFAAFRTHRINMAAMLSYAFSTPQAEIVEKELAGKATVHRFHAMTLPTVVMNTKAPPFNDVRVRKAVALALDRPRAKGVVINEFSIGGFLVPGGKWALPEDELLKMPGYRQPKDADRAEAKKLLAEAGYPDVLKEKLLDRRLGIMGEVRTQWIQDQLKKVGIQLELNIVEEARFWADVNERRFTIACLGVGHAIDDPDAWFSSTFHSKGVRNDAQFSDKEVDELLEKQSREMDEKERRELVLKAQRRVMELAPVVAIHWNLGLTGSWNEVRNWKPGMGISERTMFQDVWLAQ